MQIIFNKALIEQSYDNHTKKYANQTTWAGGYLIRVVTAAWWFFQCLTYYWEPLIIPGLFIVGKFNHTLHYRKLANQQVSN